MSDAVILTGLRANNNLHIGNYFGAIKPTIDIAKDKSSSYQINLFVPDLHSFTTPIEHNTLYNQTLSNIYSFVAAGLPMDNPNVYIYRQSYIPAHSELTWILDCFSGFGEMSRMTQFKDKSKKEPNTTVGLFNYPVLMAADILLYDASLVPVGDDQTQHLEFTRDLAGRINSRFNDQIFTVPKPVKEQHKFFSRDQGLRIKDLADPNKKMSKSSSSDKGIIFLNDTPEVATKKILSSTTDNEGIIKFDEVNQPGISNLLTILSLVTDKDIEIIKSAWVGKSSYAELKKEVARAISDFLVTYQDNLSKIDKNKVMAKLQSSEKQMNEIANQKLLKVQKAVGLRE